MIFNLIFFAADPGIKTADSELLIKFNHGLGIVLTVLLRLSD